MPLVRVGPRGQITIPNALRLETRISTGSLLEAEVRHNLIILKPVEVVDTVPAEEVAAAIAEGLEDRHQGRVTGPFANMDEFKTQRCRQKKAR